MHASFRLGRVAGVEIGVNWSWLVIFGLIAWSLGAINLVLLAFNMLPALPLDGGRVLRALVWRSTGDFTRATRTAGGIGQAFGQALIFGGILLLFLTGAFGGLWFALIGWFLFAAAGAEARMIREIDRL